jgi:hypothetical protein
MSHPRKDSKSLEFVVQWTACKLFNIVHVAKVNHEYHFEMTILMILIGFRETGTKPPLMKKILNSYQDHGALLSHWPHRPPTTTAAQPYPPLIIIP